MSLVKNLRQVSIGTLFSEHSNFIIPKYQRGYAWQDDQVEDFCSDILKCINYRKANPDSSGDLEHFFGGIVCIEESVIGSSRKKYDLIDGQQRIVTFSMLANCIIEAYEDTFESEEDDDIKELIKGRINDLKNKYRICIDEINKKRTKLNKLILSNSDSDFFLKEISNQSPDPERESNTRIKNAITKIRNFIRKNTPLDNDSKIDELKQIEEVMNDNCTIIQITTERAKDAYKLFQVLNDRGLSLSEGDLLRAKTLELLESPDLSEIQGEVGLLWDDILKDEPTRIKNYLTWYFSGTIGKPPKSTEVFDDYIKKIFKINEDTIITQEKAAQIKRTILDIKLSVDTMSKLTNGEWPYSQNSNSVCKWDKDRLRILTTYLNHTNCIPLLLTSTKLDQKKFADIVHSIEKFVFRYKIICNQHIGKASSIYLNHAKTITGNKDEFDINVLKRDLQKLINERAPDEKFKIRHKVRNQISHIQKQ